MSIIEKKKNIEFSYSDDGGFKYDVVFDPLSGAISIMNTCGESIFSCPVSLLCETISFLIQKGCSLPTSKHNFPSPLLSVGSHQREMSGLPQVSIPQGTPIQKSPLPIPEIVRKDDSVDVRNQYKMKSPTDPVSSFNVFDTSVEVADGASGVPITAIDIPDGILEEAKKRANSGDENFVDANKFFESIENKQENTSKNKVNDAETINRPVIRSRVKKGDPLSAEKEASDLRSGLTKSEKRIKRASDSESE